MSAVARLGDTSDHGGTIVSASTDTFVNGIGVARQLDQHSCPVPGHGTTDLFAIATHTLVNGRLVITIGARAGCGATITSGSPNVFVE